MRDQQAGRRSPLWDVQYTADGESEYECLNCGAEVAATGHPGTCPRCGAALRNRGMSIE